MTIIATHIKDYDELTIVDNFLFQKVMHNKRICKMLIEKILKIRIKAARGSQGRTRERDQESNPDAQRTGY